MNHRLPLNQATQYEIQPVIGKSFGTLRQISNVVLLLQLNRELPVVLIVCYFGWYQ